MCVLTHPKVTACSRAHCECVLSFQTHSLRLTQDQLDLLSFYVVRMEAAAAGQYPTIVLTDYGLFC